MFQCPQSQSTEIIEEISSSDDQTRTNESRAAACSNRRRYDEAFSEDEEKESEQLTDKSIEMLDSDKGTCLERVSSESQMCEPFTCTVPNCQQSFETTIAYDSHYNMRHRYVCATCKKVLLSGHFLELHVLETHDTLFQLMAERSPMFQCYEEACKLKFKDVKERKNHCVTVHEYKKNFKSWQKSNNSKGKKLPNKSKMNQNFTRTAMSTESTVEIRGAELKNEKVMPVDNKTDSDAKEIEGNPKRTTNNRPVHFTFGHSASKSFIPKFTFGQNFNAKTYSKNLKKNSIDLSGIEKALPTVFVEDTHLNSLLDEKPMGDAVPD